MSPAPGIPAEIVRQIIREWIGQYGPTFPLYGAETDRSDISGSVRPLLTSTALSHEVLLAEKSKVSRRIIKKILSGELQAVDTKVVEALVDGMDRADVWYNELDAYRR